MGKEKFEAKNVSKIERDELIFKLEELKEQVNNEEQQTINQVIRKLKDESKLGLNFDHFEEEIDEILKDNIPVLKEVEEKRINKSESLDYNFLIEGDNLPALHLLNKTHKGRIDVIYIDPPYNTGNEDFVYNDSFVDENDGYRHSKWLSFIEKRLILAKELMSDDGVIFISIDEHEFANLKILCDEIFGQENFLGDFIRKTKTTTNDSNTGVNQQHEYTFCYAKDYCNIELKGEEKDFSKYKNPDNDPNGAWIIGDPSAKSGTMENNYFEVINPYTGKVDLPPQNAFWRFSKNTMQSHIDSGRLCFKKEHKREERGFIWKRYKNQLKSENKKLDTLEFADTKYINSQGTKEFNTFGTDGFSNPKPVGFVKKILQSTKKDAVILDFFAGSGTTAQAVIEQNSLDGGNRKFILVTNNENNICESITYERIKKVINGYVSSSSYSKVIYSEKITYSILKNNNKLKEMLSKAEGLKSENDKIKFSDGKLEVIQENKKENKVQGIKDNLIYQKIDFVNKESIDIEKGEYLSDELINYCKELIELRHMCKLNTNGVYYANSNEEISDIISNNEVTDIYYSKDEFNINKNNTIDLNNKNINIHVIPNCFYEKELRENGEL